MKLKFDIETHRDKAGNWVAQVVLAGRVIHEDTGPVSESQAIGNATTGFASLLAGAIERQSEWEMGEAEVE